MFQVLSSGLPMIFQIIRLPYGHSDHVSNSQSFLGWLLQSSKANS